MSSQLTVEGEDLVLLSGLVTGAAPEHGSLSESGFSKGQLLIEARTHQPERMN